MKPLVTFRPRERRLALLAAVVIGVYALVSWMVEPLWNRTRDLRHHIETQQGKLAALSDLLKQAPAIEQDRAEVAAYLSGDEGEEGGAFLSELEALARRSRVQLNLKPRSAKREERVSRFEVELDVEGSQETLLAFLDELLRMPRLLTIDRLRIASLPSKERSLRANLVIQKLTILR